MNFIKIILEPLIEEINGKKIIAVNDATYAVAKRKPEKIQACWDSNPDLCDNGAALVSGVSIFSMNSR